MPTYEYKCDNCDYDFELFQSIKEEALKKCPKCGKNSLKKLISGGAGLIFKGTGFYKTDYADIKSKPAAKKSELPGTGDTVPKVDTKSKEEKKKTVKK